MEIINAIAPVFLLILLGKGLEELRFFPAQFLDQLNRFVYYLALPALLITRISQAQFEMGSTIRMVSLFFIATLTTLLIAWLLGRIQRLTPAKAGAFMQGSFRGNGVFVGLPIILYAAGTLHPDAEQLASVMIAPIIIIFNLLAVTVLLQCGTLDRAQGRPAVFLAKHLFKNPMIVSCIIGLLINQLGTPLPPLIERPMDLLGSAALPLILLSIGATLDLAGLRDTAAPTLIASLLKVIITPLIGLLLITPLQLAPTQAMVTLIFLGVPTAGTSYVMAELLGCDAPLAGRIIALSTLLSFFTLPWLIALGP
jgi:predicted permease